MSHQIINKIFCAIYARYSSENQDETSIEDQIRKCREFAASRGWVIIDDHIYYDKALSGSSIAPREGFKKLLSIALSGNAPFQYILVSDTSRVARNTLEALQVFASLKFVGIHVFYVNQSIDTAQNTAEEMLTVHALVDSMYIKKISFETRKALEGRVSKGYNGGGRHYGYISKPEYSGKTDKNGNPKADGFRLEIKPDEAKTILRIFELFGIKNYSAKRIATLLNAELKATEHPKPPRGKFWCASTILGSKKNFRGILNNEIYIGKYSWNKTTQEKNLTGGKKTVKNDIAKWKIKEKPELRIISDYLWSKVKNRQKEIKDKAQGILNKAKHLYSENLLTKIAKCGTCGGTFGIVSGGKYGKYGCTTNWNKGSSACPNCIKIKKEILEEAVIATLCKELSKKDPMALIISEIHCSLKEFMEDTVKGRQKATIEYELMTVQQELENISNAIKRGIITDTTERLLVAAESRERELKNELLLFEVDNLDEIKITEAITQKDMEEYFAKVINGLINPETTREILYSIVDRIIVHCEKEAYIDVEIHESLKNTISYVMDLIGKKDARIKLQTGTGLQLYTSRVFKCRIVLASSGNPLLDAENVILTVGGCL